VYHPQCFRAGPPFGTRLVNHEGLGFPPTISWWPHLICEACTVRAVLGRELTGSLRDQSLLMLERVRMLDMLHSVSKNTHKVYQAKVKVIRTFERDFGVPVLQSTPLQCPPHGPAIPTMWAQQRYSVTERGRYRSTADVCTPLKWNTVRGLRSAASYFFTMDASVSNPSTMYDPGNRLIVTSDCLPTDEAGYKWMSTGMQNRLGDSVQPSTPLLERHILWIDNMLDNQFNGSANPRQQSSACRAAIANLSGWMGWLRGGEQFQLKWSDTTVIPPASGLTVGLPSGVGMVGLQLLEQTKSAQSYRANVVIAFTTGSGLSLGKWIERLRALVNPLPSDYIMCHPSGRPWNSHFFRHQYLYPWLETQRGLGDPFLQQFDGSRPGNSIKEKCWSFHAYRRGACTHVSRKRATNIRKATQVEVYEHGRWRQKHSSADVDKAYQEWSLEDRIMITLMCM
jgi:hypothetical protein